jgi:molybdate transport system substrate-binding protein
MPRCRVSLALALVATLAPGARAAEILVHGAASLTDALGELAAAHETATGVKVRLNLAASNTLARQIQEGAPGDVFFSADEATMDKLQSAGLLAKGTRVSLLANTLVVVVPEDATRHLASSADLATDAVKSVALADPGSVPAGIYAKEHLRRIGAWRRVLPKVVPTENVRAALAAVESGNVDAGIVYATDARIARHVRVECAIPRDQAPDISYPAAVLSGSEHAAEARAFLDFLRSPQARAVFERYGFIVRP